MIAHKSKLKNGILWASGPHHGGDGDGDGGERERERHSVWGDTPHQTAGIAVLQLRKNLSGERLCALAAEVYAWCRRSLCEGRIAPPLPPHQK